MISNLIVFRQGETPQAIVPLSVLENNFVTIDNRQQSQDSIKRTFQLIEEWRNEQLWINSSSQPMILKYISDIFFPKMWKLRFHSCQLESIEGLSRIRLPNMRQFVISHNKIISLEDFKKSDFTNLESFYAYQNRINQISSLSHAKKLHFCSVQWLADNHEQCPDIRWIAKVNCPLSQVWISSSRRIKQEKVQSILKKKYEEISFRKN